MGRLWNAIKSGVRKAGRFMGNVAGKVGEIAGHLSFIPGASTVQKIANVVSKVGGGVDKLIGRAEAAKQKYQPTINKVVDAGKAVYKTGIPDKLTGGAITRVIDKTRQLAGQAERGINRASAQVDQMNKRVNNGSLLSKFAAIAAKNPNAMKFVH